VEGFRIAGLFKLMLHGNDHEFFAQEQGLGRGLESSPAQNSGGMFQMPEKQGITGRVPGKTTFGY
jgi:hypothetical protein